MTDEIIELVFKALGDETRRKILEQLRSGPKTTGEICEHFQMSRFGVMKHLRLLEAASLISVEWRGRERWNYLNAYTLQSVLTPWV